MKIAYLDCFSGISGDMFLAALVDAGVPLRVLEEAVSALHLDAHLRSGRVDRSGISAIKIDVLTAEGHSAESSPMNQNVHNHSHSGNEDVAPHTHGGEHSHHAHPEQTTVAHAHPPHTHGRSLSVIRKMILDSMLIPPVQQMALNAFELLGAAEAKIHNTSIESIHFHEVGAVDAIVDIVATAAGCHWLGVDQWMCSPLNVGGGHVHCAHGTFPVPAPAALELLRDLPVYSSGVQKELVTPTGAALLRALNVRPSAFPAMSMQATGYGAGSHNFPGKPNVLRLVIGEAVSHRALLSEENSAAQERTGIIETTIDDATPELLSYVADRLLAAGASDVVRTPVLMKKGRSGIQLTVACPPDKAKTLQRMIFRETTTLGLRYREEEKVRLDRGFISVETEWGTIQMKIGKTDEGEIVTFAPEFEDCRKLAEKTSVPLKQVMQAAVTAFLAHNAVPDASGNVRR